jgi:hypothetical protein
MASHILDPDHHGPLLTITHRAAHLYWLGERAGQPSDMY